jgi:beta-aspartyl-peptidase (threonine type)
MSRDRIAIAVHGGAGPISASAIARRRPGMERAAAAGWRVLEDGGSAFDAAIAAVVVLEDDPRFNAGRGSFLTEEGVVEMDASVMEGTTLRAGAVAAVRQVANPILAARAVVAEAREVFLVGEPVVALARRHALRVVADDELITAAARRAWLARRAAPGETVGAVARDARGGVAAATSTGGVAGKRCGRVGDSAVIGAGTYADDASGAVSATGPGEAIIRLGLARVRARRPARRGHARGGRDRGASPSPRAHRRERGPRDRRSGRARRHRPHDDRHARRLAHRRDGPDRDAMRRAVAPAWWRRSPISRSRSSACVPSPGIPASLLPYPAEAEKHGVVLLDRADQAFTVRAIADNANRLVTAPSTLFATGQCHPFPHPQTLGEHLLGESLLAAAPFALTRDPILTFNAVVLLSLLVPALAMYALARTWTGNAAAGFVAGLLFAFHRGGWSRRRSPSSRGTGGRRSFSSSCTA